jgi:hypothetical protein
MMYRSIFHASAIVSDGAAGTAYQADYAFPGMRMIRSRSVILNPSVVSFL